MKRTTTKRPDYKSDLKRMERIARKMNMPEHFMKTTRAMLVPGGIDYAALKAAGADPAIAFQCEALAESVSTDGVLDPDKWEALMRSVGLLDEEGRRISDPGQIAAAKTRFEAKRKDESKRDFIGRVEAHLGPRAFHRWVETFEGITVEEGRARLQAMAEEIGCEYRFVD
jgi:hypothetical protein